MRSDSCARILYWRETPLKFSTLTKGSCGSTSRRIFSVAPTTYSFSGVEKLVSLISCLTLSLGCPERHVVLERTWMRSVFLLLSALRKNSILFNILNTHDRPVRPFLDALAAMPRLLRWVAACHHLQLLYYSILFCPATRKKSPFLPDTLPSSLCRNTAHITRSCTNTRRESNPRSTRFDRYPSEFLPATLAVFKAIPLHPSHLPRS